jgi:K(+)-stimulated pyrophosphate-energized sodium pump
MTGQILPAVIGTSLIALIYGGFLMKQTLQAPSGEGKLKGVALAIQEGAKAYITRQYKMMAILGTIITIGLGWGIDWSTAVAFVVGALASGLAGYIGLATAVRANSRTAQAAKHGQNQAMQVATKGSAVTGFFVSGLALMSIGGFYSITGNLDALLGLLLGGAMISIFARLGGGIFTKAADVGADLVGKTEAGIPEDDPRNPAVIADNVGDNVGDCAGAAADLFETYTVVLVAAMLFADMQFSQQALVTYPLALAAIATLAAIIGVFTLRFDGKSVKRRLYRSLTATGILALIGFWFVNQSQLNGVANINPTQIFYTTLIGFFVTGLLLMMTEYYTGTEHQPVRSLAKSSEAGHGTNVISGLALSMKSAALPIFTLLLGVLAVFQFNGLFAVIVFAVSMLSFTTIIAMLSTFGPITDNAGGIVEMAELGEKAQANIAPLDAAGDSMKAATKTFTVTGAALVGWVMFGVYALSSETSGVKLKLSLDNPEVIAGVFIGGIVVYLFSAKALDAVGRAAGDVVIEVRRQFREIDGIMEGTTKPDYAKAVDLVTKEAIWKMRVPALIAVLAPVIVGLTLGIEALGGMLAGTIVIGLFVAISMTNGGSAWDNAKKYIEAGNFGGKGGFAHQASVTGDAVGDPYKDTAGPAIGPLMKLLSIIALLMLGLLL